MSLIRRKSQSTAAAEDEDFISLKEAGSLLDLHPETIRRRLGGTESFTHIRQGKPGSKKPRIVLLRSEVLTHKRMLIEDAKAKSRQHITLVWNQQ